MLKVWKIFLLFAFISKFSCAQTPTTNEDVDNQQNQNLELLGEQNGDDNVDYTSLIENLQQFKQNPINLNSTNKEELADLQLLSEIQINALLTHIEKNGKLLTIYELQSIDGFDLETINKIKPYVKVTDNFNSAHFSINEMFKSGSNEVVLRYQRVLEKQAGYTSRTLQQLQESPSKYYVGGEERIFARYRFRYSNNVSWGITGEKDAGETFKKIDSLNKKAGFDFYSAHFFLRNIKFVKALAIGDYQASFGQGLTMWKGFGFGKSIAIVNMKRNAMGLRSYNSVDENRFLRGAATTLKFGKIEATAFFSSKKVDANISRADTNSTGLLDAEEVSSLIVTGSHTTIGEIKDRHVITETIIGGNLGYKGKRLNLGLTAQSYNLSAPLKKTATIYNQYDFSGKQNANAGIDFSYVIKNVNLFGEAAISKNGGKAFVGGAIVTLDPRLTFVGYYRNLGKDYQNTIALAISENTLPQNEKGLYIGTEAKLGKGFTLTAYFDQYKFPWLKSSASSSTTGHDFLSQLNWTPNKKTDMYFRFRNRGREENAIIPDKFDYVVPVIQNNFRYNVSFQLLPSLKLRSRVEYLTYKKTGAANETGLMIFQDVVYKKLGKPFEITARYGLFETTSFTSRIYSYENDVLYAFSIPALYEKGNRMYFMVDYNVTKKIELWFRIGQTFFNNKSIQSEGSLTQINKPTKTDIKLQLRIKI